MFSLSVILFNFKNTLFFSFTDMMLLHLQYLVCYKMRLNISYNITETNINILPKMLRTKITLKKNLKGLLLVAARSSLFVWLFFLLFPVFAPQIIQISIIVVEQSAQLTQNTEGNEWFACKHNFLVSFSLIGMNLELGYGGLLQSGGSGMDSRLCKCPCGICMFPSASTVFSDTVVSSHSPK